MIETFQMKSRIGVTVEVRDPWKADLYARHGWKPLGTTKLRLEMWRTGRVMSRLGISTRRAAKGLRVLGKTVKEDSQ